MPVLRPRRLGISGRLRRFAARLGRLAAIPALLVRTGDVRTLALPILLQQIRLAALRARSRDGTVPRRELAVRVVDAAPEALAEAALALGESAAAVGTGDAFER